MRRFCEWVTAVMPADFVEWGCRARMFALFILQQTPLSTLSVSVSATVQFIQRSVTTDRLFFRKAVKYNPASSSAK